MNLINSLLISAISFLALRIIIRRSRRWSLLPPGPKGLPILGNLSVLAADKGDDVQPIWVTYTNWSRVYGDVFSFHVLGTRTVVLNSYKSVMELLERRSYNYSDRPRWPMLGELMRYAWMLSVMEYSDRWRLHRRTFHQFFQPRRVPDYYDMQRERTADLVRKLTTTPQDLFKHVRMHAGGAILEVLYGYRIQENDDPYVKMIDESMEGPREAGVFGRYWVDHLPLLKHLPAWLPGAGFRSKAEEWARRAERSRDVPWMYLKQQMADGNAAPSFCSHNFEKFGISTSTSASVMEEVIKNCAGVGFAAGADTTVSAILTFVLGMVLNPQAQIRAQKELEDVVGLSRLPDFSDRENLPFINAILSETLRWKPVLPLSLVHGAMEDDMYDGYLIPAGSAVISNMWAILQDETLYGPDTSSFNPERFMKHDGKDLPPNPELFAFGSGRRICPGRYFAINTLWMVMTHFLTAFTMAKELDDQGKEVDPVVAYTDELLSHPLPFKCRFIPRPSITLFQ